MNAIGISCLSSKVDQKYAVFCTEEDFLRSAHYGADRSVTILG